MSKKNKNTDGSDVVTRVKEVSVKKDGYLGSVKFFRHMIISIVALAIIVPTTIAVILALKSNDVFENLLTGEIIIDSRGTPRGVLVTPDNIDELLAQQRERVGDGQYRTRMTTTWSFDKWDSPSSDAFVENSLVNTRAVYFNLVLKETNELVCSSPFMPVGSKYEKFALDKAVPAGEHSAIVTYHLVDDNYEDITTVSVAVLLRIKG